MSILKGVEKRKYTYYTRYTEDFSARLAITKDNGALLRFDRYKDPTDPTKTPPVTFTTAIGEPAFSSIHLVLDTDPRYAKFVLPATAYPDMFRSRKVYFECVGKETTTGLTETLFYGELFINP